MRATFKLNYPVFWAVNWFVMFLCVVMSFVTIRRERAMIELLEQQFHEYKSTHDGCSGASDMQDPDERLFSINTAWGRGYVFGIISPRSDPPWAPGATGSEWSRGFHHAIAEIGWLGAVDTLEEAAGHG